jgi:hypothetical protein
MMHIQSSQSGVGKLTLRVGATRETFTLFEVPFINSSSTRKWVESQVIRIHFTELNKAQQRSEWSLKLPEYILQDSVFNKQLRGAIYEGE